MTTVGNSKVYLFRAITGSPCKIIYGNDYHLRLMPHHYWKNICAFSILFLVRDCPREGTFVFKSMFKSLRTHSVDGSVPVHLISIISVLHYVYAHQFFKITIIHYFYAHRFSKLNRLQLRLRTFFSNIIRFTSCFRFRICVRKRNSVRNPYTHSGVW